MKLEFDEGVTCLDCGRAMECECLIRGESIKDLYCPKCFGDELHFHRPREDCEK